MAGGSSQDNPVSLNVVPMVDVIFCLCVFFMCSFEFEQLEGAFDAWLPKNRGNVCGRATGQEIRVALAWDTEDQRTTRWFGQRVVEDEFELTQLIRGAHDDSVLRGQHDVPLIIDGDPRVPWQDVIEVVNTAKELHFENIEFALGATRDP
jgi:biopolymer transport protein ExbD